MNKMLGVGIGFFFVIDVALSVAALRTRIPTMMVDPIPSYTADLILQPTHKKLDAPAPVDEYVDDDWACWWEYGVGHSDQGPGMGWGQVCGTAETFHYDCDTYFCKDTNGVVDVVVRQKRKMPTEMELLKRQVKSLQEQVSRLP